MFIRPNGVRLADFRRKHFHFPGLLPSIHIHQHVFCLLLAGRISPLLVPCLLAPTIFRLFVVYRLSRFILSHRSAFQFTHVACTSVCYCSCSFVFFCFHMGVRFWYALQVIGGFCFCCQCVVATATIGFRRHLCYVHPACTYFYQFSLSRIVNIYLYIFI